MMQIQLTPESMDQLAVKVADILESRKKPESSKEITEAFPAKEVAKLTGKDVQTIRKHASLGLIQGVKTGKSWIFTTEAINKYIGNKNEK